MKNSIIVIAVLLCLLGSCKPDEKPRVLVFSKTAGFRHESIEVGQKALIELGQRNGFDVDTTENSQLFNEENLKRYRAVIFLNTTQNVLDNIQQADFKRFIEAGGGFVGIHAAADTEYEWPWYGKLVGAYFKSHPQIQEATVRKVKPFGPNTLPDTWVRTDELYNFKQISDNINVIFRLDESTYKGGQNGENHPIAWYHEFEGGRSFYTGLGHTNESYQDSLYLEHLAQGIEYAIGENSLNYKKVKTQRAIEENRFTKTVLDFNLDEPTELAVLPDGNILFTQRKGDVKFYDQQTGKTEVIATIPVSTKYNPNARGERREAEDGLLGLEIDPNFKKNNWVYMYYSPAGDDPKNILVRYTLNGKKLDEASKKIILEVPVQRDQCCHTGGSIAFDANGNLFLSTGDNTSPFESNGFNPADERDGRSPFDAQKSSSNTNDLRGKILRIHPESDGTYTIPEGNLFPKGEEKTRPEIYVMGNRNPYRISVDERSGYLYWGEVGPDAGTNDSLRGPRGYDEINQAKKAGFYGWPYFVGANYPYGKYDFAAGTASAKWDPAKPINESPNNTGKRELPPAMPAYIWYPYEKSDEFPMVKEGGRNAMAGPVYYSDKYKGVKTAFPEYYDGKLLIYDWMRNWMFHLTLDQNGGILDMEPFMAGTKFNNIIDMAYGPDGRLYMIEYGTAWFKQNLDARLVRIDYNGGNRPPVVQLTPSTTSGAIPLTVEFSAEGSLDYDDDEITYELETGDQKLTSADGKFKVTFDKPGVHNVKLTAKDTDGASGNAQTKVIAGNVPPVLSIDIIEGNKTFFIPGKPLKYVVKVNDNEDGSTEDGGIKHEAVTVSFDFLKGFDMAGIAQGHQMPSAELPGKSLINGSDCKSCHLVNEKSAGPSYRDIASKYKGQEQAINKLAEKIIKGGSGVWGTIEMAAHPQISVEDAREMVSYILTLDEDRPVKKLPLTGTVTPANETDGAYLLTASYYDRGGNNVPSLSSSAAKALRAAALTPDQASELSQLRVNRGQGRLSFENVKHNSSALYKNIDLTYIKSGSTGAFIIPRAGQTGGEFELRLDKPDGPIWGKGELKGEGRVQTTFKLTETKGQHDVYLIFKNAEAGDKTLFYFSGIQLYPK